MSGGNRRRAGGRSGSLRGHIKLRTEESCTHMREPGLVELVKLSDVFICMYTLCQ